MRAALYWVPDLHDPLYAAGVAWLGRDAETGARVRQPAIDGLAEITADARRYGLHATLRPPMRIATGYEEFQAAAYTVAACFEPFQLPPLILCDVGGFLALRENEPCPALQALCDRCVLETERHRLRADDAELARRRAAGLSARQEALLQRYGYPYVLDEWFFHMTLSQRLDAAAMARLRPAANSHFAAVLDTTRWVRDVCICTQLDGGDFLIAERIGFGQAD
jgi:hypothetical protein